MRPDDPPDAGALCLIAMEQPQVGEGLAGAAGRAFPGIEVVAVNGPGQASDWLGRGGRSGDARLGLALIEVGGGHAEGASVIGQVVRAHPNALAVAVGLYRDDAELFAAIGAGAHGYLFKDEEAHLLADQLRRIAQGEPPLSPAVAHRMLSHFRLPSAPQPQEALLTPYEIELLSLIAIGLTLAEAAGRLGLTPQAAGRQVNGVYRKLCISMRTLDAKKPRS